MTKEEACKAVLTAPSRQHIVNLVKQLYKDFDHDRLSAYDAGFYDARQHYDKELYNTPDTDTTEEEQEW